MDDKGFIFTADASLALVVVIVFTASIVVYALLPVYQGQDHQHLQALADSALATMEQDGTLRDAAVYYANNNSTAAQSLLINSLNSILPSDVSYKMTMNGYSPQAINSRGRDYSMATDVATGVRVISGPKEGWLGRSFYNIKEVGLMQQETNVTTTLWNFHNYLTNFSPWNTGSRLTSPYNYWGVNNGQPRSISFSVPNSTTGTVNWARFIIGSMNYDRGSAFGATININTHNYATPRANFQYLYPQGDRRFYINQTIINSADLINGASNNYYVYFNPVTNQNTLPWFSIIANYTVNMAVPQGVVTNTFMFPDNAGLAYPNGTNRVSGYTYSFNGGPVFFTRQANKVVQWNTYISNSGHTLGLENSYPFVINNVPSDSGNVPSTAVSIQQNIDNTDSGDIKDAYVVLNPYGAVDGALVEVYDPINNNWEIVFNSVSPTNTAVTGGYGNLPGTINLKPYMDKGRINKVRITVWDNSPGSDDFDFVGLTNCYAVVSSSKLPIWWDENSTDSFQSNTNSINRDIGFTIRSNQTKEAYLFFSGGLDTRNVKVEYTSGKTGTLYNGAPPYMLNLGELDASTGLHVMTNGTAANHTYIPGDYKIKVTVTSAPNGWESGDPYAEIYSGTRVAVIYPALEHAVWSTSYAPTAQQAIDEAYTLLKQRLSDQGFPQIDESLVYNESMYTGDLPNSIPVRLDLWTY